jgi:L-amino acid N-acyltransferase YncA
MTSGWLRVRPVEESDLVRIRTIINHFIATSAFNFRTEPQTIDEWRSDWRRLHESHPWLAAVKRVKCEVLAYAGHPFCGKRCAICAVVSRESSSAPKVPTSFTSLPGCP